MKCLHITTVGFYFGGSIDWNWRLVSILNLRVRLVSVKRMQWRKKCPRFSVRLQTSRLSQGVSLKLWLFLCTQRGLSPTLSWKSYFIPIGSWISKILFEGGLTSARIPSLKDLRLGELRNSGANFVPTSNTIRIETITITFGLASYFIDDIYRPTAKKVASYGRDWMFQVRSKIILNFIKVKKTSTPATIS